jgi:hypothetical protein
MVVQDGVENHRNARKQQTIDFLHENKLLISDVILQTNRNGTESGDSDLRKTVNVEQYIIEQFQLNEGLIDFIMNFPSLTNLYFTAKPNGTNSPFSLFQEICGDDGYSVSNSATNFGVLVPRISVQTVPLLRNS